MHFLSQPGVCVRLKVAADPALCPQGAVDSLRLALGGSVAKAGALTDCPFQGDASAYNSGEFISGDLRCMNDQLIQLTCTCVSFSERGGELHPG